jgi:hypothetical protein
MDGAKFASQLIAFETFGDLLPDPVTIAQKLISPLLSSAVDVGLSRDPVAIAITPVNPAGIVACPSVLLPQPTTVPLLLSARLNRNPAAIAVTLVNSVGILICA